MEEFALYIEILLFILFGFLTIKFFIKWYKLIYSVWPKERARFAQAFFIVLPIISMIMILIFIRYFGAYDIIGLYVVFYILMGYSWIAIGLVLISYFLDLSWVDDVVNLNNRSALLAISGAFLGLTIIYCGALVGEGPGWWTVVWAGGLGVFTGLALVRLINKFTNILNRITVGRDIAAGIRLGCYFIASSIILGRASSGNWHSFLLTVVEFLDGWPVLILTGVVIFIERAFIKKEQKVEKYFNRDYYKTNPLYTSIGWGSLYIILAILSVIFMPNFIKMFLTLYN